MTDRRDFLSQLTAGFGAMAFSLDGNAKLISKDEFDPTEMIGGENAWFLYSVCRGNTEPAIQELDFGIQFMTKGNCFLKTMFYPYDQENDHIGLTGVYKVILFNDKTQKCMDLFKYVIGNNEHQYCQIWILENLTKYSVAYTAEISKECINYLFTIHPTALSQVHDFMFGERKQYVVQNDMGEGL